jgi:hypothetical protein
MVISHRCDTCGRIQDESKITNLGGGRHICRNCRGRTNHLTTAAGRSLDAPTFDTCARCRAEMFVTGLTARAKYSGGPVCTSCADGRDRDEFTFPAPLHSPQETRAYVDQQLAFRAAQSPEDRAERERLEARILHGIEDEHEDRDDGPTLTPSGLWEVRTAFGPSFSSSYDRAVARWEAQ